MELLTFIKKANKKHNNFYDYSSINFNPTHKSKVTILCPLHGKFEQNVNSHLCRSGCPTCSVVRRQSKQNNRMEYIQRANTTHGNKYNYDHLPENPKTHDKVEIECPIHGIFSQILWDHLSGSNCPKCARIVAIQHIRKGTDYFLNKCKNVHGEIYDYSLFGSTVGNKDTVEIICKKHGPFLQVLDCHLSGGGCPSCAKFCGTSTTENEVNNFITSLGIKTEQSNRSILNGKELDIYIPKYNIAVEYCGVYWHSEQRGKDRMYHKRKHDMCKERGIQLITIFEDEWLEKTEQVKNKLKSLLGKDDREKIFARECVVTEICTKDKRTFFDMNHIQGDGPGSINIGLVQNNELVACMGFIKQKHQHYLNRYATSKRVVGGFSKLLKHFQNNYQWNKLISFADLRWSAGNLYETTGWELDSVLPPDYQYVKKQTRIHKFNYRRKNLPRLLDHFDPTLSERTNCDNNGLCWIWDCGKLRYVLNNED